MDKSLRPYLAELIGTFALVFVSAGAVCVNYMAAVAWQPVNPIEPVIVQPQPGLIGIALAAGLIYAVLLAATLSVSSGYLNPAIPIMLWVFKKMDTGKAFGLIFVQAVGAALAGGLLRLVFSFRDDVLTAARLGTPHMNARMFGTGGITPMVLLSGIGLELVLTFILTFVIFATLIDTGNRRWVSPWTKRWACLWAGLTLAACTLAAFPVTGAALNPARWFGTVIWEMTIPSLQLQRPFGDQVVYWFGPIAGSLLAGLVYLMVLVPEETTHAAATAAPASGKVATGAAATLFRSKK
jgi:glycerol uptake facilitator-like aquaporin